jgi:hypothetical protein
MNRIASVPRSLLAMFALWIAMPVLALAQSLPVSVDIAGKVASVQVGTPGNPIADITLTFDDVSGLSAASLGISAQTINVSDPALLARLPSSLASIPSAFPVMVTIEPPAAGGLVQRRLTHVEVHTHALPYTAGTPLRLFKAPLGGRFRDITEDVLPGSVRTRGTTPGWSQFIVVADLRPSAAVVADKVAALRATLDALPAGEAAPLGVLLDSTEAAVADARFGDAIAALDSFTARVSARAGTKIPDVWKATRDTRNLAGELLSGASTLRFSISYLRDFGG